LQREDQDGPEASDEEVEAVVLVGLRSIAYMLVRPPRPDSPKMTDYLRRSQGRVQPGYSSGHKQEVRRVELTPHADFLLRAAFLIKSTSCGSIEKAAVIR
jgi:hypothetical protein